ncbi:hypothetical protein ACIPW5_23825 [Streptomyces sp. NPDC090077]|uniref:hypothetical protein n=1 Tax=Streptomyces sp. NPDC090077 TaxID=3365938 RepID=UPI0037F483AE
MTENGQGGVPQPGTPHQAPPVPAPGYPQQPGPQPGEAWGTPPAYGYPPGQDPQAQPAVQPAAQQYSGPYESAYEPPPQPGQPAYGYPPPAGHVVGPGFEGPGDPHGYGYPPLPDAATQYIPPVPGDAATQYIPPVPAAPHEQAATQYIPPVPGDAATQYIPPVPGDAATQYIPPVPGDAATQYIPPVPADAATQYIPPVPAAGLHEQATQHMAQVPMSAAAPAEQATQYIPPVPAAGLHEQATQHMAQVPMSAAPAGPPAAPPAAGPAEGFDALFRADGDTGAGAGHTQQLPPVQDPGPVRTPPPAPPQRYGPRRAQQPQPPQQPLPQQQQQQQQQQYAPPPPPAPARRIPPAVIAAAVFGLVVAGLGVGAMLSDGKAQNTDPGAVAPAASGSANSGAAPGEAVDPARPQAVQLDKLLADASDSRTTVIKAVDDIKDCKNLAQAAQDLREAAQQREGLVTRLQELKIDLLPNNARLSASLTKAWKASADADNSYADWADGAARDKGGCKDGKAKVTDDAQDGNKSSAEATRSKESAATMWNTIAAKYGLTKRDKSQL